MTDSSASDAIREGFLKTLTTPPMEPDNGFGPVIVPSGDAPGSAQIFGTDLSDMIQAGVGDDFVWGFDGCDRLAAGQGDDFVYAGAGDDRILGGRGDDELWGGKGADVFVGGEGRDVFHLRDESDVVRDFVRGEDRILWDDFA